MKFLKVISKQRANKLGWLASKLPYAPYLAWLAQYNFRHNHHVVFDHLVAPTAFYIRREDYRAWFDRAGLTDVQLSWRNQNSWRGFGRVQPASPLPGQTAAVGAGSQS